MLSNGCWLYGICKRGKKSDGFSDFVSMQLCGYQSKRKRKNHQKYQEEIMRTLKYMVLIPNEYETRFKGILLFDVIDNEMKKDKKNENRLRFEPDFCSSPCRVRMKQRSLFIDKNNNEKNAYFELIGDLNKVCCNAKNAKTKKSWMIAMKHFNMSKQEA